MGLGTSHFRRVSDYRERVGPRHGVIAMQRLPVEKEPTAVDNGDPGRPRPVVISRKAARGTARSSSSCIARDGSNRRVVSMEECGVGWCLLGRKTTGIRALQERRIVRHRPGPCLRSARAAEGATVCWSRATCSRGSGAVCVGAHLASPRLAVGGVGPSHVHPIDSA